MIVNKNLKKQVNDDNAKRAANVAGKLALSHLIDKEGLEGGWLEMGNDCVTIKAYKSDRIVRTTRRLGNAESMLVVEGAVPSNPHGLLELYIDNIEDIKSGAIDRLDFEEMALKFTRKSNEEISVPKSLQDVWISGDAPIYILYFRANDLPCELVDVHEYEEEILLIPYVKISNFNHLFMTYKKSLPLIKSHKVTILSLKKVLLSSGILAK